MKVIEQTKSTGNFVCTWCGDRFQLAINLKRHRLKNPQCAANRSVSSPLQSRHESARNAKTVPGEEILRRVRSGNCDHTSTQEIRNHQDEVIALQCLYCYTYFEPSTDPQTAD